MRRAEVRRAGARVWLAVALAAGLVGCGPEGDSGERSASDDPLPRRAGTLVIDTCPMDSFQRATLASAATRAVVDEVVLLCLYGRDTGSLGPDAAEPRQWLSDDIQRAKDAGYRVTLGLTVGDGPISWYGTQRSTELLQQEAWRASIVSGVQAWLPAVDGVEVALPAPLANEARAGVNALVKELGAVVRPAGTLGLFVPPSLRSPSDLPGGDAYDLSTLAPGLDRVRVMTLDWSCCSRPGGPSTDAAWAAEAVDFAGRLAPGLARSVTMPLFGTDFGDKGSRSVTFVEASGLAQVHGAHVERTVSGVPHFGYTDGDGLQHDVWYDDVLSTELTLGVWASTLPADVGVLYYGLGAEDPGLWSGLARSMAR